jgi:hypothetical protein
MSDSIDPTKPIDPTRNDPSPEERVGDSRFLPVVIAAGVALVVLLIAAIVIIGGKGKKLVPQDKTPHPTSHVVMYQPTAVA